MKRFCGHQVYTWVVVRCRIAFWSGLSAVTIMTWPAGLALLNTHSFSRVWSMFGSATLYYTIAMVAVMGGTAFFQPTKSVAGLAGDWRDFALQINLPTVVFLHIPRLIIWLARRLFR